MSSRAHPWNPAGPNDSRSPCPGLNILANHDFLPHDGKGITVPMLNNALLEAYNIDVDLAHFLSAPVNAILKNGEIELHDLAKHGFIEHDASLAHDDVPAGENFASVTPNPALVESLLADSSDGETLTLGDFAKARVRVERTATNPLSPATLNIARSEPILILAVFGKNFRLAIDTAKSVFALEKLPDDFVMPTPPITRNLIGTKRDALIELISKL